MVLGRDYNDKHATTLAFLKRYLSDPEFDDVVWTSNPTPWENDHQERAYNCFGFVVDSRRWWQPVGIRGDAEGDPRFYWPITSDDSIPWVSSYIEIAKSLGFEECDEQTWDERFERILILHQRGLFVHAALQTANDRWKSKMGTLSDFEHSLPAILTVYTGHRISFMRRPRRIRALK